MNTPITLSALVFVLFMSMMFGGGIYLGHRFTKVNRWQHDVVASVGTSSGAPNHVPLWELDDGCTCDGIYGIDSRCTRRMKS